MLKSYVIMPALCSILKTMHNACYNARLICAGLIAHNSVYFGEPSLIPKFLLTCAYDTMIMQFYY